MNDPKPISTVMNEETSTERPTQQSGVECNDTSMRQEASKIRLEEKKLDFWQRILSDAILRVSSYFEQRMNQHETPLMKTGIMVAATLMGLILVGTGFLVYKGKLDAASLTFVIGTVLGYLLSFSKAILKKENE